MAIQLEPRWIAPPSFRGLAMTPEGERVSFRSLTLGIVAKAVWPRKNRREHNVGSLYALYAINFKRDAKPQVNIE